MRSGLVGTTGQELSRAALWQNNIPRRKPWDASPKREPAPKGRKKPHLIPDVLFIVPMRTRRQRESDRATGPITLLRPAGKMAQIGETVLDVLV